MMDPGSIAPTHVFAPDTWGIVDWASTRWAANPDVSGLT